MKRDFDAPSTGAARPLIYNNIVGGSVLAGSRRDRSTVGLSAHQANGVIEAALHARRIGLPFNRHVTIRLERAGIHDRDAVRVIGAFLTRVRDWLRKQGHRTSFAWVRENGAVIGSHVHILIHLPAGISLGHRSRRWMEAITMKPYRAGTIRTKRISQAAYEENLGVLVGYLCKGASPNVAEALALERRKPGGTIVGKRAGWSENVGQKARHMWTARQADGGIRGVATGASSLMVPSRAAHGVEQKIQTYPNFRKHPGPN